MEAPEKLYLSKNIYSTYMYQVPDPDDESCVEYTRTDAFIEKACELLVNCIEDFMARRMEIWDKECKKQTLENLRKAMKGE